MEKRKFFSYLGKWNTKIKNTECIALNNMANINNHHPRVHFDNNNNGSSVFTLWN